METVNNSSNRRATNSCPFLIRCFWKSGVHNTLSDYKGIRDGKYPSNEIHIYAWMDSTLREVYQLIDEQINSNPSSTLDLRLIFVDRSGNLQSKNLGQILRDTDDGCGQKHLQHFRHQIGDFIDVAIIDNRNIRKK